MKCHTKIEGNDRNDHYLYEKSYKIFINRGNRQILYDKSYKRRKYPGTSARELGDHSGITTLELLLDDHSGIARGSLEDHFQEEYQTHTCMPSMMMELTDAIVMIA